MFSVYTEYDNVALFHFHRLSFIGTASLRCHDFHFFPKPDVENGRVHAVPVLHGNVVMLPVSQKRYDRTISRDIETLDDFARRCVKSFCAFGNIVSSVPYIEDFASEKYWRICPNLRIYLTDNVIH